MPDGATSCDPTVQTQLDRLDALALPQSGPHGGLGLAKMHALMDRLDHPERDLPPVFHIAGTNGKGSTAAFLRAMMEADGKCVHAYTSPHLVRFNERIRLAGALVEDAVLAPLLGEVLDRADDLGASFFEITTAAALLAFARTSADACIVEVGLGGRLDATNVIPHPAICGIAALGIDHEAFLLAEEEGTPREAMARIAWEKAGIAKTGIALVTQSYATPIEQAVMAQAQTVNAPLLRRGHDWNAAVHQSRLHYHDAAGTLDLPLPTLPGAHQADNAALAVAMLRLQSRVRITSDAMADGIAMATWPARLQRLAPGPLTELLPSATIWLDGGHNANAGEALSVFFRERVKPLHLVIGMLANKNPDALVASLRDMLETIVVVPVPGHESHGVEAFDGRGLHVGHAPDVESALDQLAPRHLDTILIAGSLYLAGEVLRRNNQNPQ